MNDLNIIDQFTQTFVNYIDSGFGFLSPDIAFLTTILIGIDITLAGLFWAMSDDKSIMPSLIKKVLYIGAFAFILNNFQTLSTIIFQSFAGLGLNATNTSLTINDLMRPGFIAATGYQAADPILTKVGDLVGPVAFFQNFILIAVLMFAWLIVLLAFFILAIQLFITILEFKLTALAGFVLVPFALWNKTSFLAEKVLGNVVTSGIKLMVLTVIIGIGSTVFNAFINSFNGPDIPLEQALSTVLAALSLFMLGIFGPSIAAGLVSGAPQLGAGAAAGTALGLGVGAAAGGRLAMAGGRVAVSGAGGAVKAASSTAGAVNASYNLARGTSTETGVGGVAVGLSGVAPAGMGAMRQGAGIVADKMTGGVNDAYASGERAAFSATGGTLPDSAGPVTPQNATPAWAQQLQSQQNRQHMRDGASLAVHTLRDGDRGGAGDSPQLKDSDQ